MTIYSPLIDRDEGPLYKALADAIERDIQKGILTPGERLPTHRDLADELGMNVSTITRGYSEAEKRGLLSGTVGRGTFVASDAVTSTSMVSFEPAAAGMLEMGLISPFYHLDPDVTEGIKRISRRKDPTSFMRYTDPRGMPDHREAGARWAARYGLECGAEDVIVTAGAQHALTCCLSGLFRPGDRIAADALTYPGMKTLATMLGIRLVPIAMDDEGMMPEALDAACRRDRIKGVYVMPGVHNPTTATMSGKRRDEIARLADAHDLIIIEDDAYDLTAPGMLDPVGSRVRHRSVYVAGMSKSLAAGLRVAFVVAPKPYRKPLAQAVLNTIWMAPPLNGELAAMWINDGTADQVVEIKRAEAARRYMVACDMLEGLRFRGKPTGFYLWVELPEPWTGQALEKAAQADGVSVFGAEKFVVGETKPPAAARISLTGVQDMEEFRKGLWILTNILSGTK
ncbi:PLP-dependent aminotransferase family protein [Pseudodesulfovibrio sp. zrk46]|uniref:aminotransferase-like domain-containing protein n=1 Tax=Pseudodesulfovibrio sp. zrk46 TaxID=2725288 RepID=UPI00144A268A|nr:PLP-dependent aminotransferase family protein [Pseudodesulfovibrio sp. zrk46]QJB56061.1 PLP-dependent aminotransferase family protein [Pseudodesulfovibrio sp. zrk46]